jgi:hypothetical protein
LPFVEEEEEDEEDEDEEDRHRAARLMETAECRPVASLWQDRCKRETCISRVWARIDWMTRGAVEGERVGRESCGGDELRWGGEKLAKSGASWLVRGWASNKTKLTNCQN